jgi:NAD(P) transhydrogenase subunit beta
MHTDLIVAVPSWVLLAYLVAGVCFILALRGLSNPESSRRGNITGMVGMAIAVATTLATHQLASLPEIIGAMVIGGGIGLVTARMLAMYKKKERK